MTKRELYDVSPNMISKMFGSRRPNDDKLMFYQYPILINDKSTGIYRMRSYIIQYPQWEYLIQYPERWKKFLDNLFNKYNLVEVLTDIDNLMMPFGKYDFSINVNRLREKYGSQKITVMTFDGYLGFRVEENPKILLPEDNV